MAVKRSAPRFSGLMSAKGVPYGSILFTTLIALLGVGLNALVPSEALEIVLEISALGIIGCWATIMLCQIKLHSLSRAGKLSRPAFRLFGAPFTAYLTLAFLLFVLGSMAFSETGRWVLASILVLARLLIVGWFAARKGIRAAAEERQGYTGSVPVVAGRQTLNRIEE